MEEKRIVPELFVVRAVACLCIVLIHAISTVLRDDPTLTPTSAKWLTIATTLLLFSTPTFAFMSAFLLGFSRRTYHVGAVLWKRVKYLLSPFAFFALVYAAWGSYHWGFPFAQRLTYNLRGGYHGYFVLIVMQFYIAHAVLERVLSKVPPWVGLTVAGAVNFFYLMGLNLQWFGTPDPVFNWYHLFPAWVFYYVMGFYVGRHRDSFQTYLQRRLPWAVGFSLAAGLVLLYRVLSGTMPELSSQRFDVLVYAGGVICVLFGLAGKVRQVPVIVNTISRFSFGIYLWHWLFIEILWRLAAGPIARGGALGILGLGAASAAASVALTALIGTLRVGPFLVGKVGLSAREQESRSLQRSQSTEAAS